MNKDDLRRMIKLLMTHPINSAVYEYYQPKLYAGIQENMKNERERVEESINKVQLSEKHICNCKVLLSREDLIHQFPKNGCVAEIGIDTGEFSELIFQISNPKILHLIDPWDSVRYGAEKYEFVKQKFESQIHMEKVKIHRKSSIDAAQDFPDNYFDWIYIDTDHSYNTTKEELKAYASKIKMNGFISGHDYTMGNWIKGYRYGVIEAVHEFCVEYDWEIAHLTANQIENQSFAITRIHKS